jgi:hypothetical protein
MLYLMPELVVIEKIDGNPVAWRCSDCREKFSVPGKMTSHERLQKVTATFKVHTEERHKAKAVASGMVQSANASQSR